MSAKKVSKPKLPKMPLFPEEANLDLSQNTLLSTLLNDPSSRAMVLQFMSQAQKDIKYKEDQVKKVQNKLKQRRFQCESPTAQFRRKELARLDSAVSDSESSSTSSTTEKQAKDAPKVPFNELLRGLIIYVEVFSNGVDKSLSAKALVQTMGAKVSDRISRGVTHVIFKDGSYQTFQLARRLKLHVVSILWLQAVKRRGNLVPEKDYPAFGGDQGDLNVSTMCKNLHAEFDDICKDERSKINSSVNQTVFSTPQNNSNNPSTSHRGGDSEDDDDDVFLSAKSSKTTASGAQSSAKKSIVGSSKLPSDCSSELRSVDGEASKNLNDSLELTSNIIEMSPAPNTNRRRTLYNPEDNSMIEINMSKNKRKTMFATPVLKESNKAKSSKITGSSAQSSAKKSVESSTKVPSDCSSVASKNLNDSLELTSNIIEISPKSNRNRRQTLYNPEDNSMIEINMSKNKRKTMFAIPVLKESNRDSTASQSKEDSMELTCLIDTSTKSNENNPAISRRSTASLESNKSVNSSTRSSMNSNSMDLTSFANARRRSVRIASKSEEMFKKPVEPAKGTESRESSFSEKLSCLRLSTESDKNDSTNESNKKRASSENGQQRVNKEDNNLVRRRSNPTDSPIDKGASLRSENLTSSLRLSDSQQFSNKAECQRESTDKLSTTDNSSDKRVMQSENLTSSLRLSESNNKSATSELMGELSQLRLDNSKKRLSDEENLTPSKKTRQEKDAAKPRLVSESSCSDGSVQKKSRKLYDIEDPSHDEFIVELSSVKPQPNLVKGRVKKAMELISKPFELTPEIGRGKVIPLVSTDEEGDTNSKTATRKRLTKVRPANGAKNKKTEDLPKASTSKAPTQVFATPKTPKKPPSTPSRKSSRFATPVTYKKFYEADDQTSSMDESVITPKLNRRSTMDFSTPMRTTLSSMTQKTDSASKKSSPMGGIACTRFKVSRVNTFSHIVRRLGRFHIDDNVVARTTHLVVGENKRTVNLLRAIARGCWILSSDWLYKSMTAGKWLSEEDYEFTDFSDAVQFCRKERQAFGPTYTADTFVSCGPIYIARRGTKPSCDELRELVRLAGGSVAPVARSATIVVGEVVKRYDTVRWCVSELWVLDSVMKNQLEDCAGYSLVEDGEEGGGLKERRLSDDY